MKLAICNDLFQGWPEEKIFRYVAELGYQGIEIAPFMYGKNVNEITEEIRAQIRQTASRYQLEIVGLHWVFRSGKYLAHPSRTSRSHQDQRLFNCFNKVLCRYRGPGDCRWFPKTT